MGRVAAAVLSLIVLAAVPSAERVRAADPSVLAAQAARIDVVEKIAPAVVSIFAKGGAGGGSGVLISPDGYALSNFHVTSGSGEFMKCGLNDGVLYDAVIVGIDPTGDVALIKLLGRDDFPHAALGDSDRVRVGDWVLVMGNPFLLATDFHPTLTYGIVSGVHRYQPPAGTFLEYTDCIQVDASINPGNSGGPLFNSDGELIGINGRASFDKRGRVNSGAGYAISINQIKNFLDRLKGGLIVDHATLGATVRSEDDGSVVIDQILLQSEAFRRGLRQDDELVRFAGRPIRSVNQFKNVLGIYPSGWKLPLTYRRDGETFDIVVRLRSLHSESEMMPEQRQPGPPLPHGHPPTPDAGPPADYAHMFVKKRGFANYYFNELQQQQLLEQVRQLGEFGDAAGLWRLAGQAGEGVPFELTLADQGLGLLVGDRAFSHELTDDLELLDEPPGTGGLLIGMHQFRLLLTQGPEAFLETFYFGSEPLDGTGPTVDVLVTRWKTAETYWYFGRSGEGLVGFDMVREEDVDACEVRFLSMAPMGGKILPQVFRVRSGGRLFGEFRVERAQLMDADEP